LYLGIFQCPSKFLNSCEIVYYWTIDYIQHSRIRIK